MYSADRRRKQRTGGRRQRGYTFVEIAVTLSLMAGMALIVERTLDSTRRAEQYMAAVRKATERGQRLTYEVRELATASRRLFFRDASGQAFLDALELDRAPMAAGARLPLVEPLGRLGPDEPGAPRTGNVLFFVSETDATPAIVDPDVPTVRYIDTYRFVCCYPSLTGREVVYEEGRPKALDLVVWQSVEFPNYTQLKAISDPDERAAVVADLYDRHGHRMAWNPTGEVHDSFHALGSDGSIADTPSATPEIQEDLDESEGGRLVYANTQLARTDNDSPRRKAVFTVEDPSTWAPNGFEVKVVGPSGSRRLWMHLVVEVQADRGRIAVHPGSVIVSVKDM